MTAGGRALTAAFLLALAPAPGCSWVFVGKAPQRPVPSQPPVKCSTSDAAPGLDAGIGGVFALVGLVGGSLGGAMAEDGSESAWVLLGAGLVSLGIAAVYALSAGYGFENTKACLEFKEAQEKCVAGVEEACRFLEAAPPPPPPPPEVPAAMEGPPAAVPPPAAEAQPAAETRQEKGRPNVGDPCKKPEDCRDGARCLLDDLGNGTCVEPEPVTPAPGR